MTGIGELLRLTKDVRDQRVLYVKVFGTKDAPKTGGYVGDIEALRAKGKPISEKVDEVFDLGTAAGVRKMLKMYDIANKFAEVQDGE